MTQDLDTLRLVAKWQPPELVAAYQTLWTYLWDDERHKLAKVMHRGPLDPPVRRVMLDLQTTLTAFLADGVPEPTARMVALEFIRGSYP